MFLKISIKKLQGIFDKKKKKRTTHVLLSKQMSTADSVLFANTEEDTVERFGTACASCLLIFPIDVRLSYNFYPIIFSVYYLEKVLFQKYDIPAHYCLNPLGQVNK